MILELELKTTEPDIPFCARSSCSLLLAETCLHSKQTLMVYSAFYSIGVVLNH